MKEEIRTWMVEYDHKDGRSGKVTARTEVTKGGGFQYGNGKAGCLKVGDYTRVYDLRYNKGDLHRVMIDDYFGSGLVAVTEM